MRRQRSGAPTGHIYRPTGDPHDPAVEAGTTRGHHLTVVRSPFPPEPGALDVTTMLPVTRVTVVSQTRAAAHLRAGE